MNPIIQKVTAQIISRSKTSRTIYLTRLEDAKKRYTKRQLGCSNVAHAIAPLDEKEKHRLSSMKSTNLGIITAYNDMLSAHSPYHFYPQIIKDTAAKYGATAQVAGGVPAMCDGVTQGQVGMELSLFSRDNIAMGSAIGLSHNVYDGVIFLGVCDKIVPGLVISALSFGHLPAIFIPAGPMKSGVSNAKKAKVRQEFAQGKVGESELLKVESQSYHSCGTCTFFGTANSNQMLLEMMGLQLPNSSFVNAQTPLRELLTIEATKVLLELCQNNRHSLGDIIDERSFVNAIVGLMATGGSTNHTIHLIAMARAAGIILTWDDFDAISKVTPLLCRMYPNGSGDVNHFREAGGMSVVIHQLLELGLVHDDVQTIIGKGLHRYVVQPTLKEGVVVFDEGEKATLDETIIAPKNAPFSSEGGLKLLKGNIGRSVIKTSALKAEQFVIKAPAIVFESQDALKEAFIKGTLEKDFIAVVRFQGPKANGMPELHGLLPSLGVLQDKGFKVAIITDGRMSGASGKVPSAIHLTPEATNGGVIAKIQTGDMISFDVNSGEINLLVDESTLQFRSNSSLDLSSNQFGLGRELFSVSRKQVSSAEEGATVFDLVGEE